jgi:hypothetical protein
VAFNVNGDSKFGRAMSSGLLATIAWGIVLVTYCAFRAFGIEDPILGQVFLLLTGLWVGNLTIAQGKKQARTEEAAVTAKVTAEEAERKVEELAEGAETSLHRADAAEQRADAAERRADSSEERETEWSKHKDHHGKDGG